MLPTFSKDEIRQIVQEAGRKLPPAQLDEMAVPSYLHSNPLITWLLRKRYRSILNLAQLSGTESVLDFGCGIGLLLPLLCEQAGSVHATDLEPEMAQRLVERRGLSVTFHPADQLASSIADHSLDVIVAQESMEHLDDPRSYVRLFQSKLKIGGRLVMSGPTENVVYRIGRAVAGFGGKGHYHRTNVDDLDKLISQCGMVRMKHAQLPFSVLPGIYKIAAYHNRAA